ncbi:hypothetical protein [Sporolactobacillus pectinivorans]|uniref:hypothetical protein n=1 Tax=Sporolactobacillus pectinivorans TaxID=1591408 RepID=UPI000C26AEE4|nr:hypothetical protein [Sporolactobacillus pectinivorans]
MGKLYEALKENDLNKSLIYARNIDYKELFDEICSYINQDINNLFWYTVLLKLLLEKETPELHEVLFNIFITDLVYVDGAPQSALFHAKRSIELSNEKDPNYVQYLVNLLILSVAPYHLVPQEKSKPIVQKVLKLDPNNEFVKNEMEFGGFH